MYCRSCAMRGAGRRLRFSLDSLVAGRTPRGFRGINSTVELDLVPGVVAGMVNLSVLSPHGPETRPSARGTDRTTDVFVHV